jgi:hypothetical protein
VTSTLSLTHRAPKQIIAGDTIEFLEKIPADLVGWTGTARLTGPSTMDGVVAVSGVDSTAFDVRFAGVGGTDALLPGSYILTIWATSGSDRFTVKQYRLTIQANLAIGSPALAHAIQTLTVIETAIYNRLNANTDGGIEQYLIDGREVRKLPLKQLYGMRAIYTAEVRKLQNPDQPLGRIKVKFTQAGDIPDMVMRYAHPQERGPGDFHP